jgi:hypothetical protein
VCIHTEFVDIGLFIIYFHIKFKVPTPHDSLITMKRKAKYKLHFFAMLFYIIQKITSTRVAYFSRICYHTTFRDPYLPGAGVTSKSNVRATAMFVFVMKLKNTKVE